MSGMPANSPVRAALEQAMAQRNQAAGGGEPSAPPGGGGISPQEILQDIASVIKLLTGIGQAMQSNPQTAQQIVALVSGGGPQGGSPAPMPQQGPPGA